MMHHSSLNNYGGVSFYWDWNLTENGQTTNSTIYSTTKITDLAINFVKFL